MQRILEALIATYSGNDIDLCESIMFTPENLDLLRILLNRQISNKYTRKDNTLVVYLLDEKIEHRLAQKQPVESSERSQFLEPVYRELGALPPTDQNPIVLTKIEVRRRLRRLIEKELPNVAVLCYHDLSPELTIQPIGRIA
jgi:type III secretion protein V